MNDLIEALKAATEGSGPLDAEVLRAFGWTLRKTTIGTRHIPKWCDPNGTLYQHAPAPTRRIDDALLLVPDGLNIYVFRDCGSWFARTERFAQGEWVTVSSSGCCDESPALAVCIAALKASVTP